MFINNNHALFHWWWKENLSKHQKILKYYENDCRLILQKQPLEMFLKNKLLLKNFVIFTGNTSLFLVKLQTPLFKFLFNKTAGLSLATLLKGNSNFPVNIMKFVRTLILKNICKRLLLILSKRYMKFNVDFWKNQIFSFFQVNSKSNTGVSFWASDFLGTQIYLRTQSCKGMATENQSVCTNQDTTRHIAFCYFLPK